ncbi:hypothetical protein ACO0LH_18770 [Undibacterium sp. TJN19]
MAKNPSLSLAFQQRLKSEVDSNEGFSDNFMTGACDFDKPQADAH